MDDFQLTDDELSKAGYISRNSVMSALDDVDKIIKDSQRDHPKPQEPATDRMDLNRKLTEALHNVDLSANYNERGMTSLPDFENKYAAQEERPATPQSSAELTESLRKSLYPEEVDNGNG